MHYTRASLFLLSSFHASSGTSIEVAASFNTTTEIGDLPAEDVPQNATEWESIVSDSAWSVTESHGADGGAQWDACRYYEVGSFANGVTEFLSGAMGGE